MVMAGEELKKVLEPCRRNTPGYEHQDGANVDVTSNLHKKITSFAASELNSHALQLNKDTDEMVLFRFCSFAMQCCYQQYGDL